MKRYEIDYFDGEIGKFYESDVLTASDIRDAVFAAGTGFEVYAEFATSEQACLAWAECHADIAEYDFRGSRKILAVKAYEFYVREYDEDGDLESEELIGSEYPQYIGSQVKREISEQFDEWRDETGNVGYSIDYFRLIPESKKVEAVATDGMGREMVF